MMIKTDAREVPAVPRWASEVQLVASVETLLYVTLAVLAAALRLVRLDWMPLDRTEAALALPAWNAASAVPVVSLPPSPLLFHLERLVFWLFGGGDQTARLVPALAGVGMVLLAVRLRALVGRPAALAAGAILALSPLWVYFGRQVSATTLASAAVVAALGALAGQGRRDRNLLPLTAALALAAGAVSYTLVVAVAIYVVLMAIQRRAGTLLDAYMDRWPEVADRQSAGMVFAFTLVLSATGLLGRPDGFAALLESAAAWWGHLADPGVGAWSGFLLPLLAYAPFVLVFGLIGVGKAVLDGDRFGVFLAVWLGSGLLVGWLAGEPALVADALLPLTLAAGVALGHLAEDLVGGFEWGEDGVMTGILLTVLGFALIQAVTAAEATDTSAWYLLLGSLLLSAALVAVYAILWGGGLAARVTGLTALIALGALGWANGSHLNYGSGLVLREPMRPSYVTNDAARLAENLAAASWANTRDPNEMSTRVDPQLEPALAWVLRERRDLNWAPVAGGAIDERAVVAPPGSQDTANWPGTYRGQPYAVAADWYPDFSPVGGTTFLRWLFQRRPAQEMTSSGDVAFEQAVLFIRVD